MYSVTTMLKNFSLEHHDITEMQHAIQQLATFSTPTSSAIMIPLLTCSTLLAAYKPNYSLYLPEKSMMNKHTHI